MHNDAVQHSRERVIALLAGASVGAAAVVVSQWHVLPPMQCFALLTAGLAILGATAWVSAKWYLPMAAGARSRTAAPMANAPAAVPPRPRATHARS